MVVVAAADVDEAPLVEDEPAVVDVDAFVDTLDVLLVDEEEPQASSNADRAPAPAAMTTDRRKNSRRLHRFAIGPLCVGKGDILARTRPDVVIFSAWAGVPSFKSGSPPPIYE